MKFSHIRWLTSACITIERHKMFEIILPPLLIFVVNQHVIAWNCHGVINDENNFCKVPRMSIFSLHINKMQKFMQSSYILVHSSSEVPLSRRRQIHSLIELLELCTKIFKTNLKYMMHVFIRKLVQVEVPINYILL